MTIIDRYVLRQFLKTFFICFVSLTGLYIIFDAFTNLETFLKCSEKLGGPAKVMIPYYAYRSVLFFDRTSSLLTLTAAMFTVTWIQRHNELTALMSAGVSRLRVITPILVAAFVFSGLATANREMCIPRLAAELAKTPKDIAGDQAQELKATFDNQTEISIQGWATYANEMRISQPNFLLPPALSAYGTQLLAENAYYKPPKDGHPGGYLFRNIREPKGLDNKPSLALSGKPVLITPRDGAGWVQPGECFVVTDFAFNQLQDATTYRQFASTRELIAGLYNPNFVYGADVRTMIHSRMVQPMLDVTLLFLGLPLVVSRQSRNVFFAIGLCMGIVTLFLMISMALQALGSTSLISPAFAAWAPLMLFVPVAVWLSDGMRM